jgi:hypothetical protein
MGVTWTGLDAYEAELAAWPADTADAAAEKVKARAQSAYEQIRANYPVITGQLRDGLTIRDTTPNPLQPKWTVQNEVIYARIFESGGMTSGGPKAPGKAFVPTAMRERRAMKDEIIAVVKATGADRVVDGG